MIESVSMAGMLGFVRIWDWSWNWPFATGRATRRVKDVTTRRSIRRQWALTSTLDPLWISAVPTLIIIEGFWSRSPVPTAAAEVTPPSGTAQSKGNFITLTALDNGDGNFHSWSRHWFIRIDWIEVDRVRIAASTWDHHRRRRVALVPPSPPTANWSELITTTTYPPAGRNTKVESFNSITILPAALSFSDIFLHPWTPLEESWNTSATDEPLTFI